MMTTLAETDIQERKKRLRNEIIDKRNNISITERFDASKRIKDALFNLTEFKNAKSVHFFVSFGSEVITSEMIKDAIKIGKSVVVPFVDREKKELRLWPTLNLQR